MFCCSDIIEIMFKPFPHITTNLQKTYLENKWKLPFKWRYYHWRELRNMVTKGEIVRFVQFLLFVVMFFKSRLLQGSLVYFITVCWMVWGWWRGRDWEVPWWHDESGSRFWYAPSFLSSLFALVNPFPHTTKDFAIIKSKI